MNEYLKKLRLVDVVLTPETAELKLGDRVVSRVISQIDIMHNDQRIGHIREVVGIDTDYRGVDFTILNKSFSGTSVRAAKLLVIRWEASILEDLEG